MTTTAWTTLVALSALGLATSPLASARLATTEATHAVRGGPPDTLVANPRTSSLRWRGTGLGGRGVRSGTVALTSGMLVIRHETLTSGTFTVDMRTLDAALRGADFFDVSRYPTAVFNTTGAKRIGQAQWQVSGNLTMHGITRPLTFATTVRWEEVGHMIATANVGLDRRAWGVGSAGPVDDDIQLVITLDARRKQAAVATR